MKRRFSRLSRKTKAEIFASAILAADVRRELARPAPASWANAQLAKYDAVSSVLFGLRVVGLACLVLVVWFFRGNLASLVP